MAKILIIDDDPDITISTQSVLESKGHEVISALEGTIGITKAINEKPDLIILDVMMPGIDGFKVARSLRKDDKTKEIPILMLTAIKDKLGLDLKEEAEDRGFSGVNEYCEKPLSLEDLTNKIDNLLNRIN